MLKDKINLLLYKTEIGDDYPVRLMGVINVSSESFYKGSVYTPGLISKTAETMINSNAAFLDIGGRSTAPQAGAITVEEEKIVYVPAWKDYFHQLIVGRHLFLLIHSTGK